MTTLADIEREKQAGLAELQKLITDAGLKRNAATSDDEVTKCDAAIDQLEAKRDELLGQAYERERNSPEMQDAVDKLKAVTATMKAVASMMTTVTNSQNAYYWVYLGIIEKETGALADDLHEYLKRKLLPPRFKTIRGEDIKLPASTTELDKAAFGEYLDKISALSGVPLPDPEAAGYISNYGPKHS